MRHYLFATKPTDIFAVLVNCQNCERPRLMSIKAIRPKFRGEDSIIYRCDKCGSETTKTMK